MSDKKKKSATLIYNELYVKVCMMQTYIAFESVHDANIFYLNRIFHNQLSEFKIMLV